MVPVDCCRHHDGQEPKPRTHKSLPVRIFPRAIPIDPQNHVQAIPILMSDLELHSRCSFRMQS